MTNLSNLSQEEIKELEELKDYPIDYSEIPQITDFSKAQFKYFNIKPKKQTITLRLDSDILSVLKSFGKGYQTRLNDILRSVVINHQMPVLN